MNLADFAGKKVTLVRNLDKPNSLGHLAEELEGKIEVVAPDGSALVLLPKGKTMNMMLELSEIEPDSIQVVIEKPRELKSRKHSISVLLNVRQHLLDRHAWTLTEVNNVSDERALAMHTDLSHDGLGHHHVDTTGSDFD